jgi:hypothetical protein
MEIILFSLFTAIGLLIVLARTLGLNRMLRYSKVLDIIITFGIPFLFVGTFSGMVTSFFTGLWFTLLTVGLTMIVNPQKHSDQEEDKEGSKRNCPTRFRRIKVCPH